MNKYLKYFLSLLLILVYFSWRNESSSVRVSKRSKEPTARTPASKEDSIQSSTRQQKEKKLELLLAKIAESKNSNEECRPDESCEDLSAPGDEYYFKTKRLEGDLAKLNQFVLASGSQSFRLSETGRELLDYEDGSIKEKALQLLISQPEDVDNIDSVVKGVLDYHDAKLIPLAVTELQRYLGDQNAFKVHWGVRDCLLTGSLMVKEELSTILRPFINDGSIQFYRDLSLSPSLDKRIKENLISTIEEYQKQTSGG